MDGVVLVVVRTAASHRAHLYTRILHGPENSSNDQCLAPAYDNWTLCFSAGG